MNVRIECQSEIRAVSVDSAMISKSKPHIGSVVVDMHLQDPEMKGKKMGKLAMITRWALSLIGQTPPT